MNNIEIRKIIREEINLILNEGNANEVYHDTYTSAVNSALDYAREKGYKVDDEDIEGQVTFRGGKPRNGQTAKHHIKLYKNGVLQRKYLNFQVYNTGKSFELNLYIQ